ncbi:unnamed protein product [Brachionus calyciflorus]|uniref:Peptidase S1 domain-containing protein n=1 Tax=Brachionus calyciflorus TaxID=104777 RepID=A0A814ATX4_9BILA|nr:unnamed protein product [Brachionus calyciflorus]
MKFLSLAFCLTLIHQLPYLKQITAQFDFNCGVPDVKSQIKIVNGQVALDNAWPWMVAIIYKNRFICGGSIIAPDWIITAAHCVEDDLDPFNYNFFYGINNLNDSQKETAFASKIYMHPDYFPTVIYNDIALIKLTKKIKFSKKVKPICLPKTGKLDEIENKKVVATGWGKTNGDPSTRSSKILLQTSLIIKNNKTEKGCNYRRYNNYCTLGASGDSGVCQGDSGGPLQFFKNGKWYLYGITSFVLGTKENTCIDTKPSFFATVPFYLNLIKSVVAGKPTQPLVKKNCGIRPQKKIIGVTVGTLVSNQHVLTLKNGIFESNLKNIFVALGSNELYDFPDSDKLYSVISIKKVSDFLVVLKLHRAVTNPNVSPICLPNSQQSSLIFNKQITTAGWGSFNGTKNFFSSSIRETKLTVNNNANECRDFSGFFYCTFGKNTNICFGDDGNPVMYSLDKKWTLFGFYYWHLYGCINKMRFALNIVKYVDLINSALD